MQTAQRQADLAHESGKLRVGQGREMRRQGRRKRRWLWSTAHDKTLRDKGFCLRPDANRGVAGTWQDWRYRNLGTGVSKETPAKACRRRAKQWRENWSALCLRRSSRDSNGTPIPVPLLNGTWRLSVGLGGGGKADTGNAG